MTHERLAELIDAWSEGCLSSTDIQELNEHLRGSEEAREMFRSAAKLHGLLHAATNELAVECASQPLIPFQIENSLPPKTNTHWRNALSVLLGLFAGVISVSAVWAYAANSFVTISTTVASLHDGSFEAISAKIPTGFPRALGVWGGDDAVVVNLNANASVDGKHAVRFVAALPDSSHPEARSIACDLFQLIELRDLHATPHDHDAVLELTAQFLDQRPHNTKPSVTFFCQVYLFNGDPSTAYQKWPEVISEAVSSGSAEVTTLGDSGWQGITARCFVPDKVSFAVVHIAARPNLRVPMPEGLFADNVQLVFKTQPVLPVRRSQAE